MYILSLEVLILLVSVQCYNFSTINRCQPPSTNVKRWNQRIRERFLLIPGYVLPRGLVFFLSRVNSLLTIGDRHWRKVATMFEKSESANSLPFAVHFHMNAYKRDVKMGAYIHGVIILCGCLSRFYGISYLPCLHTFWHASYIFILYVSVFFDVNLSYSQT